MKQYMNRLMVVAGCTLVLAACDDNSWNDKLDGFEEPRPTDVRTIDYTLTAVDYKTLAANSTNKALAGEALAGDLAAVGSQGYFTDKITARDYIPALLSDPKFPYFALSDGSAIKVTYNVAEALPTEVAQAAGAKKYVVTDEDYQSVWGSEDDYTAAFAPSHTAARSIPGLLKSHFADAQAGECVIVNYNTSATDPVFTTTPGPDVPGFTPSSVLGSLSSMAKGDEVTADAVVMAISTQGPIIADATGAVFTYQPTNNSELKIGDQLTVSTTLDSYNYGWQLAKGSSPEVSGNQSVTYPAPKAWTGAEIDEFVSSSMAAGASPISPVYSKFTGTVTVSGNYINIALDGTTVQVSPYGAGSTLKGLLTDGATVTFEGYVMAIASKGKYLNTIITKVGDSSISTLAANAASRAVTVASTNENAIYTFNGSTWAPMVNTVVLSHSDYQAMGQNYDNLSGEGPATYLPIFMKQKYPYAQAEDAHFVVYYYYNGSETVTRCDQYAFNGTEWVLNNGVATETAQFVRNGGKWMYDPNVTITLPAGRGIAISTLYYQTCVDWVKNNVPDGAAYVSSYGNNEYYSGTSAYQGNVDLRPTAAKTQYAGYSSMTDEEVVALEKQRFETEVLPAALAILHPDAVPVSGLEVLFTINFYYYDGTTKPATIIYEVTGPAQFTFKSCTWNDAE